MFDRLYADLACPSLSCFTLRTRTRTSVLDIPTGDTDITVTPATYFPTLRHRNTGPQG